MNHFHEENHLNSSKLRADSLKQLTKPPERSMLDSRINTHKQMEWQSKKKFYQTNIHTRFTTADQSVEGKSVQREEKCLKCEIRDQAYNKQLKWKHFIINTIQKQRRQTNKQINDTHP